jgi:polyketide synthase PksN
MVMLKTVGEALKAGDHIYATIKSIAINNDGRTAGPASPNIEAQKQVMQTALSKCGVSPGEVSYIEVNGSGSEVTDLIEMKAIQAVYRTSGATPCRLGSIKPNIGHPLCAEGIAGFIKVVQMLHHKQFVPFLSGVQPLKYFDMDASPFLFSRVVSEWPEDLKMAAINCFADGGTNAHVILAAWTAGGQGAVSRRAPIAVPVLHRRDFRPDMTPEARERPRETLSIWETFE